MFVYVRWYCHFVRRLSEDVLYLFLSIIVDRTVRQKLRSPDSGPFRKVYADPCSSEYLSFSSKIFWFIQCLFRYTHDYFLSKNGYLKINYSMIKEIIKSVQFSPFGPSTFWPFGPSIFIWTRSLSSRWTVHFYLDSLSAVVDPLSAVEVKVNGPKGQKVDGPKHENWTIFWSFVSNFFRWVEKSLRKMKIFIN